MKSVEKPRQALYGRKRASGKAHQRTFMHAQYGDMMYGRSEGGCSSSAKRKARQNVLPAEQTFFCKDEPGKVRIRRWVLRSPLSIGARYRPCHLPSSWPTHAKLPNSCARNARTETQLHAPLPVRWEAEHEFLLDSMRARAFLSIKLHLA